MTPQERDLIVHLLDRLKQTAGQAKDPEADALIRQAVAAQPDGPYYLVQTVLIQDMTLQNAQARITELEQQLAAAKQTAQPTSFLGRLVGGGAPAASAPSAGPWSRPAAPPPQQQAAPAPGPWSQPAAQPMPQPMAAAPMMQPMMQSGAGGFLRQAATTAAGVAGGALLFEGIQSLFSHHSGGMLSDASYQPGISETVINNYYGSDQGAPGGPDYQTADYERGGAADPGVDYASNDDLSSDQDFTSNDDDNFA
jgi:hypothetical protein